MNGKVVVAILKIAGRSLDILTLKQCPVCKENFDEIRQNIEPSKMVKENSIKKTKTENQLHIVKHFSSELHTHLSTKGHRGPYLCLLVSCRALNII